jgi:stage V sporulation protein B
MNKRALLARKSSLQKIRRLGLFFPIGSALSGSFFLTLAQVAFAFSGYLVNVGLARILGPDVYGQYGVTISVLIWLEILLSFGLATVTTKMSAEFPASAKEIVKLTLKYTIFCSLILFFLTLFLAKPIAEWLSDDEICVFLRIAAIDLLFYGILKVLMAVNIGIRRYARTSLIIIVYAISKAGFILGLAVGGLGIKGALVGNFVATVFGLFIGFWFMRQLEESAVKRDRFYSAMKISLPSTIWAICIILLMSTDLWAAKAMVGGEAIGYYVAAAALAKLIYFLSTGIRMIVLPEISARIAKSGYEVAKNSMVRMTLYFLPAMLGLIFMLHFFSDQIVRIVYSKAYSPAAPILRVMLLAYFAVTFCEFFCHALTAVGKAWTAAKVFLVLSLLSVPVNIIMVKKSGIIGAVYGFGTLSGIGAVASCILLFHIFGTAENCNR